jgi:glutamate racemase
LRAEHPGLPIIGVEPALKPAVAISHTKRIAVLATRSTLHSAKFHTLLQSLAGQAEFICTPCDGLADLIERSAEAQDTTDLIAACAIHIRATGQFGIQNGELDTLVLGCTHYPLVLPAFRQAVGAAVQIVDNGQAVARRAEEVLRRLGLLNAVADLPSKLVLLSSDHPLALQAAAQRWLG